MNDHKKPNPAAKLKNLPWATQEALLLFLDGDGTTENPPHSMRQAAAWLKEDGISTNIGSLSDWRYWFLDARSYKQLEDQTGQMLQEAKDKGWVKTAEEEVAAGRSFFLRLARQQKDNLSFVRILREKSRAQSIAVMERKITLLEEREAKIKDVIQDSKLTPAEQDARYKQILGIT